ncbi:MAG: hypothetical protein PHC38_07840 [Weeksellaceae bacterium]|nr:hypothetical protein [Weeksellaceae bacterium]
MIKYIIGVVLVIVGVVIGMGLQHYYPLFSFEDKIDIVGMATLVVTIFLAVYIPVFLERNMHNKRSEKDVIIRKIEALQVTIRTVNYTVAECVQKQTVSSANKALIVNLFTTISNELDTIIKLSDLSKKNKFNKDFEEIKYIRYQYRKIVTGGDFDAKRGFKFTMLDKKEEEKIYHQFDKALCVLIFKVNGL